jgi:hypothetical protein
MAMTRHELDLQVNADYKHPKSELFIQKAIALMTTKNISKLCTQQTKGHALN